MQVELSVAHMRGLIALERGVDASSIFVRQAGAYEYLPGVGFGGQAVVLATAVVEEVARCVPA